MFWFKRSPSAVQITKRARDIRSLWTDEEQRKRQSEGIARQESLYRALMKSALAQQPSTSS